MNKKVMIYVLIFIAGVAAAPAVRKLPLMDKLPTIG